MPTTSLETLTEARHYQLLCDQVRYSADAPIGEGWEVIAPDFNSALGWRARAYKDKEGQVVVAFRGTKTFKEAFFLDSQIAVGVVPNIQKDVDDWLKQNNLTPTAYTGHSLGGTLASIVSVDQGKKPAHVFDTPGAPGHTKEDLVNVTAYQSEQNPINDVNSGYEKAGTVHTIPLPPEILEEMALRQTSLEQLSKSYYVDNDATRGIKTAYKLVSTLQSLGDVHSVDNMGISINQRISLLDPKINTDTQQGTYSAQMLFQVQQANYLTQELIASANDSQLSAGDFNAQRKAAEQSLQNAKTSLELYQAKYPLEDADKETLQLLEAQVDGLYVAVKDQSSQSIKSNTTLHKTQENFQKNIDKEAVPMVDQAFKALTSLNEKNTELALEVLESLGLN